ncbi:MAG TPA: hypothetical protein VG015_06610 [Candidatus Dormibacteraeota bacterium]|jgi:hypothetical protein|nr:hypothetical protein [Candidatus Dormibacteraeota bacterium]
MAMNIIPLPPSLFGFEVSVVDLKDHLPKGAVQASQVSTWANVSTSQGTGPAPADFQAITDDPGMVQITIAIVRQTPGQTVRGSIRKQRGGWAWVGGGQSISLEASDPCVTRVWPAGHGMTDHEYSEFCLTRITSRSESTPWTIGLTYDLANDVIGGDASGPAGSLLSLQKDLGSNGQISVSLTVTGLARSFARDIRPLFRDSDITCMNEMRQTPRINLASYADVRPYAAMILQALSASENGFSPHMPQDGWWPVASRLVFKQWVEQGTPP